MKRRVTFKSNKFHFFLFLWMDFFYYYFRCCVFSLWSPLTLNVPSRWSSLYPWKRRSGILLAIAFAPTYRTHEPNESSHPFPSYHRFIIRSINFDSMTFVSNRIELVIKKKKTVLFCSSLPESFFFTISKAARSACGLRIFFGKMTWKHNKFDAPNA